MDTKQFLESLYQYASGYITLWDKKTKQTAWIDIDDIDTIADTAQGAIDVYFGVGLGSVKKYAGRLTMDEITCLPGLWVDIDIAGDGHKSKNLPASSEQAIEFINKLPISPTIIVNSGGGLHCYWLFREPWELDTPEERLTAQGVSKGWQDYIRSRTSWVIDGTHDLPRVLRLPGTINGKGEPVTVQVISHNDNRYNPSDFQEYAAAVITQDKRDRFKRNPSDGPASDVISQCAYMQVCRDHAHELSEPQWVAMLSNIARCSDGVTAAHELSRPYVGYSEKETSDKIYHVLNNLHPTTCQYIQDTLQFPGCPDGGCGVKSPVGFALAKSKKPASGGNAGVTVDDKPVPDGFFDVDTDSTGIEKFTDLGNAERFAKMFRGKLAYCKQMGKWLIWSGSRWEKDNSDQVMTFAKKCIRSLYGYAAGVDDPIFRKAILKHANSSESLKSIKSMITIAQSELPVALHDLDADQWILNCQNGIVDLRTGQLMPHDSVKNATKISPAVFSTDAECPVFEKFIHSTFAGNEEIIKFMQRLLGYCLTGETREQQFAIAFGSGRNGKGTLLNLVLDIMGDYAQTTPTDTLYRKKNEGVSNDIARLMGARFVLASEGEEGKRFDEALIKKMTGQDRMAARFLHQEFFEFMPQFKIMLMTNDKPIARGDDMALWARIQLIPFTQKFDGSKKDDTLKDKLRSPAEMSGILKWLVEGCLEWQRIGLCPPEEVVQATAEYRNESDKFQNWIEECCAVDAHAVCASHDLYKSFQAWSLSNGDRHIVTSVAFSKQLVKKGFENFKGGGGCRKFKGIGLLVENNCQLEEQKNNPW